MQGDRIPLIRDGDGLDVDVENQHRAATNGLLGMGVSSPLTLSWFGGSPFFGCSVPEAFAVFWTTEAIPTATVTGTLVSTAKWTYGGGTARICIDDGSGNPIPDVNAQDQTIYNPVVMTSPTSINTAMFVICGLIRGLWVILLTAKCPS